jgi:hypothetical protein
MARRNAPVPSAPTAGCSRIRGCDFKIVAGRNARGTRIFGMNHRRSRVLSGVAAAASMVLLAVACGGSEPAAPATSPAAAPKAPPAASSAAPAAPGVVKIVEPAEGSSSGHIDMFRWAAVDGATGYRMRLTASTDGRTVWESPVVTAPEAHLPNTIALEPEGYMWTVTALKGETVIATSPTSRFAVTP